MIHSHDDDYEEEDDDTQPMTTMMHDDGASTVLPDGIDIDVTQTAFVCAHAKNTLALHVRLGMHVRVNCKCLCSQN